MPARLGEPNALSGPGPAPAASRMAVARLAGIHPIATPPISELVAEQILGLLIAEDLAEGARLPPERELAVRFATSRPTVSHALRRLSLLGVVEIRRGSGAYLIRRPHGLAPVKLSFDLNHESVAELAQARLWLETLGAEQAARRPEPLPATESAGLRAALARLVQASGNTSQWIVADTIFHAAIVSAAGNSYLTALYESVHTAVLGYEFEQWLTDEIEPPWLTTTDAVAQLALHQPILDAVLHRRPLIARSAVLAHHEVLMTHLLTGRHPKT